jgi:ABC-2 type transport system permease protein
MRLLLHEFRGEQKLYWRSRELAFFTFALPIIIFLLLGSVYGNDTIEHIKGSWYLLAGMLGYGVVATTFAGLSIVLVIRREEGILKRLRATPLPAWAYIGAVLGSTLTVFAIEALALVLIGRAAFGVPIPHHLFSLILVLLLSALTFTALGLALTALVRSAEGSSAVVNAIYLPMLFISGAFFSAHSSPRFLRAIADVLPLTYVIRLSRDVMWRGAEIWSRPGWVAVIAAWGAIGVVAAIRGFRWEPHGQG